MIISVRALSNLDGPNVWWSKPATSGEMVIRLSDEMPAAECLRLIRVLAAEIGALDDPDTPVPPLDILPFEPDAGLAAIVVRLALNLERRVGFDVQFSAAFPLQDGSGHRFAFAHEDHRVGEAAIRLACRIVNHHFGGSNAPLDYDLEFTRRFSFLARSRRHGTAAQVVVNEARRRGIPVQRTDPSGRVTDLGNGMYRKRMHGSITSHTSVMAQRICGDKELTSRYLRQAGLPVPEERLVRTAEQAVAAANELGYPVVLKPVDVGGSHGVVVGVADEMQVRDRFAESLDVSPSKRVLVQSHVSGRDYRVLVVNGAVVAASWHRRAFVTGDGVRSVNELIAWENATLRVDRMLVPFKKIKDDGEVDRVLGAQGLHRASVPAAGQEIDVRATGKEIQGGIVYDLTDDIHPDNAEICVLAARAVGSDIVSMDVVATDITQSIWTHGGAILDLNIGSGFKNELAPFEGQVRDPGPAIIDMLFPPGSIARAPLIAVIGSADEGCATVRAIADQLRTLGRTIGVASRDGVTIGQRTWREGDATDVEGARLVLDHPSTEIAVLQVDPSRVMAEGLAFDYADVVVVTSLSGLWTPFGRPVETVVTDLAVQSTLILNAGDAVAAAFADVSSGQTVLADVDAIPGIVVSAVR